MSDYYDLGLDSLSIPTGTTGTVSTSSDSFLTDFWEDTKGYIEDGISIAGDIAGLINSWDDVGSSGSYSEQYTPADEQTLSNINSQAKASIATGTASGSSWIAGVPNTVVVLGGVGLVFAMLALTKGGK